MWKIDSADSAGSQPSRPAAGAIKFFSLALKTIVPDWWFNMVQNEMYNVVDHFGITPDKADDTQLAAAIDAAIAQGKSDNLYVDMTGGSGTIALTQSAGGDHTYNVSEFDNVGSTLEPSEIRMLHIRMSIASFEGVGDGNITATVGGIDGQQIGFLSIAETGSNEGLGTVVIPYNIPVNKNQTTIKFTLSGYTRSFEIIGVTQRVAG
jgi:hypothetical protein